MTVIELSRGVVGKLPPATVLCLGNFDGVHRGHRALIAAARRMRDARFPDAALGVFCFRGLSSDYLSEEPPGHLTTEEERLELFREAGAEVAILADFAALRNTEPQVFIRDILMRDCHCVAAACGFNHRFGRRGAGSPSDLRDAFGKDGVTVCEPIVCGGGTVSSTRIRRLLTEGRPEAAAELLGRPYRLTAEVTGGARLGRTIGFPTVNQRFAERSLIPRAGVYLTECRVGGQTYAGVTDIGTRPTVDGAHEVRCETHLLDFEGDLYGQRVTVAFLRYLREEKRFESVDALRRQIGADRDTARRLYAAK